MKKIKVLFAIGNLNIGGAQKLVVNQVRYIDKDVFEPHVCTLFPHGEHTYNQALADQGIPWREFNFKGLSDIRGWVAMYAYLRKENFDILCSNLFEENFIIRVLNLFAGRKPVFIFEHNTYWYKRWWKILVDRWLARGTVKIFADSQAVIDFTAKQERIPLEKFAVMPYPIELSAQAGDPATIKKDLGVPQESFVVSAVARFVEQKGLDYLIKAAKKVLEASPRADVYFLLVGYGKMEAELKGLIRELGIEDRCFVRAAQGIEKILPIVDIFVISSLWEAQPISMLEAMGAGCPVVATSVGGIPEIIVDRANGLLVPAKDADALASGITELIDDEELRHALAQRGKETAMEYNAGASIERLSKYFLDAYALFHPETHEE